MDGAELAIQRGMWEVIEHLPVGTETQALAEVHRALASGETLLLSTPNNHVISIIMDPACLLGHRHYDVKGLVKFITELGFSLEQLYDEIASVH